MTKEELEKEAAEFEESNIVYQAAKREDGTDYAKKVCKVTIKEAYLAAAEPREKRIAELEKENSKLILGNKSLSEKLISVTREKLDLQKDKGNLTDKVKELEAQIEKMKECGSFWE